MLVKQIVIQINDHPKITSCSLGISEDYLMLMLSSGRDVVHTEFINLYENPELFELYNSWGWNLSNVQNFITGLVTDFDETSPATANSN